MYAVRALPLDTTFLTLTVRQTELGSLTFVRLRLLLTEQTRPFRFALVAFAPVRLSALNYKKTSAYKSGSLFAIVDERISDGCAKINAENGKTVSVFAFGGEARGVCIRGLYYTLEDGVLSPDFPLGVSNHATGEEAEVAVKEGTLLIIEEI